MKWIIRNIALALAMAGARRLWRAYRRHRAHERTVIEPARR